MTISNDLKDIYVLGSVDSTPQYSEVGTSQGNILTKSALSFVALLHRTFNGTRKQLMKNRELLQKELDSGKSLGLLDDAEARGIREDPSWKGPVLGKGLEDRRVEITGPPERRMVVNALNANVKTYMADFEDSMAPTWKNVLDGQVNLYDATREQIDFVRKDNGKAYKLSEEAKKRATLVRPRGWHMVDKHIIVDEEPISASLLDFGLYFYHNAKELLDRGRGPYFYLPKMEHHHEAKLWNDVFKLAQQQLGIPQGSVRATVLIETLPAAYQIEEIVYQLREHSAGLNSGRWDYIFSTVKRLISDPGKLLPDRDQVTMTVPFMEAYCKRLIHVCHKREVHAMGGMAAQIPIKNDAAANEVAMRKVKNDKLREAKMGYDGTWVAHPDLAYIALDVFDKLMPNQNQISNIPPEEVSAATLSDTAIPNGKITLKGIRENIYIALCYIESWLRGVGCVPINYLMEDAATAEVSRLQIHSWVKHSAALADTGDTVTPELVSSILKEEVKTLSDKNGEGSKFSLAAKYLEPEIRAENLSEFLTTLIYDEIVSTNEPLDSSQLKE